MFEALHQYLFVVSGLGLCLALSAPHLGPPCLLLLGHFGCLDRRNPWSWGQTSEGGDSPMSGNAPRGLGGIAAPSAVVEFRLPLLLAA